MFRGVHGVPVGERRLRARDDGAGGVGEDGKKLDLLLLLNRPTDHGTKKESKKLKRNGEERKGENAKVKYTTYMPRTLTKGAHHPPALRLTTSAVARTPLYTGPKSTTIIEPTPTHFQGKETVHT